MVPDAQQPDEPKDHEFGSYCFEELEPAKVFETVSMEIIETQAATSEFEKGLIDLRKSCEVNNTVLKFEEKPLRNHTHLESSESGKQSRNSHSSFCVEITEHEDVREITLLLKPKQLQELQKNDIYCRYIAKKLHKDQQLQKIFIKENGVLYRLWIEDGPTHKCILVPQVLQDSMIILAHDCSGHNGSRRTYNCLKK